MEGERRSLWPETGRGFMRFSRCGVRRSGAAAPERAVTPCDEGQAILVAGPAGVFRQLEFLLGRVPALAAQAERLHLVGGILHQGEDFLRILLGAEPVVGL